MKRHATAKIAALTLLALLALPSLAQQPRYKLIDLGTFGGPQSYLPDGNDGNNAVAILNNRGTVTGWADTSSSDPFPDFCFNEDCFVSHAFQYSNGVNTDLGPLAAGLSSQANWISSNGMVTGIAENGEIDPLVSGLPEVHGVLWRNQRILDLGTLPEGGYESWANAVNNKGQVIGWATNTIPDDNSMAAPGFLPTQTRAFLWERGTMRDLGTLGTGTDAIAQFVNDRGQIVGWSYTGGTPPPVCLFPEATGSFIWDEKDGIRDLGNLGGSCAIVTGINNDGVVIGDNVDNQPLQRAFRWKDGTIQDLGGTLGGLETGAEAINESGRIVGVATLPGELLYHATLWRDLGQLTDLGVLSGDLCSFPSSINSKMQVVGASLMGSPDAGCTFDNTTSAFLWQDNAMLDLNALIAPGASLHLRSAEGVNERGEIAGVGLEIVNGEVTDTAHAFLLIPCNNAADCQEETIGSAGTAAGNSMFTMERRQAGGSSKSLGLTQHRRSKPFAIPGGGVGPAFQRRLPPALRNTPLLNGITAAKGEVSATSSCGSGEGKGDLISNREMPPGLTEKGYCTVNFSNNMLTGECNGFIPFSHTCGGGYVPRQCPPTQTARKPEYVTCGVGVIRQDVSRLCTFTFP